VPKENRHSTQTALALKNEWKSKQKQTLSVSASTRRRPPGNDSIAAPAAKAAKNYRAGKQNFAA